jgi:hypothetical protein
MSRSNIFVYIELSKLVSGLTTNIQSAKESLKIQSSYFNIIPSKYFSDTLSMEWEDILRQILVHSPSKEERPFMNAVSHSIEHMSQMDCLAVSANIISLHQKVVREFA